MSIKDYLYQQPIQLYVIEILSIIYFIFQLVLSHITHSVTLQFASYHMICKIIALTGRLITIKYSNRANQLRILENDLTKSTSHTTTIQNGISNSQLKNGNVINDKNGKINGNIEENKFIKDSKIIPVSQSDRINYENKLRNTFGWTRINVLTMSIIFIVLASLSFSNIVDAIKMLVHMDHKDTTHYPLPLLACGAIGLFLNGLCYFLIGGYTIHLVRFCKFKNRPNNLFICDDDIDKIKNNENLSNNKTILPTTNNVENLKLDKNGMNENININQTEQTNLDDDLILMMKNKRQGWYQIVADISSSIFVMICGISVHLFSIFCEGDSAKYFDPILAILSSLILLVMMYSYVRESCMILLQTIPGTINIQNFRKNLLEKFKEISVHDLHIWSLTSKKYVSTVHIIFKDPNLYLNTIHQIKKYFYEQGITSVAIQPEFRCEILSKSNGTDSRKLPRHSNEYSLSCNDCLVPCLAPACAEKSCCNMSCDLKEIISNSTLSNGNVNSSITCKNSIIPSSCPSSVAVVQQIQQLDVQNLENKCKSSHIVKFNNKNNHILELKNEELNGNYKIISQNKDDVVDLKNNYNSINLNGKTLTNENSCNSKSS